MPWEKGQSGCPGGSGKGAQKKQKQIKELLMHLTPKAVKVIEKMLDDHSPENSGYAAAKEVFDRVYGKAPQSMEVSGKDGSPLTPPVAIIIES